MLSGLSVAGGIMLGLIVLCMLVAGLFRLIEVVAESRLRSSLISMIQTVIAVGGMALLLSGMVYLVALVVR
jgi:hypothetical protein